MALIDKFLDMIRDSSIDEDDFTKPELSKCEELIEEEPAETYVKVAELTNLNDLALLKKEIYKGNILMIDISIIKNDKLIIDRALKGLKDVVGEVHGDIAGLEKDKVLVTPTGVKIDRSKIAGGRH